ncbi:MAG: hypothetical protein LBP35_04190 [Candidatus Ancillula trichonymphae]|jgi:hypothetical protein|nr:hypothetical protein [Candidatus Ancillula trichonymphae]
MRAIGVSSAANNAVALPTDGKEQLRNLPIDATTYIIKDNIKNSKFRRTSVPVCKSNNSTVNADPSAAQAGADPTIASLRTVSGDEVALVVMNTYNNTEGNIAPEVICDFSPTSPCRK